MKKRGITIAGSMLVDYVKVIDVYAAKGMLCNIIDILRSVGGCAPNTLCDLAALDPTLPLKCIGVVGDDKEGEYLREELQKRGIDIEDVQTLTDEVTSFTDVMTVESTGERTFFQARGANRIFSDAHIPFEKIYDGIFHIGYALLLDKLDEWDPEYGSRMAYVLKKVQEQGIATSMDVVSEESEHFSKVIVPSLKYLNYLIINEIEAGKIAGIELAEVNGTYNEKDIRMACEKMLDYGIKDWVVIHAPMGAWAMNSNRKLYFMSSLKLPDNYIKGSVGAGDAFCAGMLLCLYRGIAMEEALKIANAAAASNLAAMDSVSGMKALDEVKELYKKFGFR